MSMAVRLARMDLDGHRLDGLRRMAVTVVAVGAVNMGRGSGYMAVVMVAIGTVNVGSRGDGGSRCRC